MIIPSNGYTWKFFRAGGLDQVNLQTAEDFLNLEKLDQKLWVALSCPTKGLEFDTKTLELIDTDKDGRIRVPEILEAVRWAARHLKNPTDLVKGGDLPLSAINDKEPSGAKILASARQILTNLGKSDASLLTVADTVDTAKIFAQTKFNGDGVIPPDSAPDAETKQVILDIAATLGSKPDRCGAAGITQELTDKFFAELLALNAWNEQNKTPGVLPLSEATTAAYAALKAVRNKVDDYFSRCRLAAFDVRATLPLNRAEAEFVALAGKNLATYGDEVVNLPLARVEANRALPLAEGLNPAWIGAMTAFRSAVVTPLLGAEKATLTEAEWKNLTGQFTAYEAWLGSKPATAVEKLGLERIQKILAGNGKEAITKLIAQDVALTAEVTEIAAADRLVRYYRDLYTLLNNFVAFSDFYNPQKPAIFQCGTLYLDTRSCELCMKVDDIGKHAAMAAMGSIYLAYCQCTRPSGEKMTIAAAFTAGDADNLREGRNGIFYDRQGRDWDATIVKIVEHPISIRQAALLPYKRLARLIGDQVEKIAAARDKAQQDKMSTHVEQTAKTVEAGKPGQPAPAAPAAGAGQAGMQNMLGVFALLSVAISSLVGGLSAALASFLGLSWWQMPLAITGIFLAVSGPAMIIAWLKLRKRNLGPVLDACGWAINSRVKLNIPLGRTLTKLAKLPDNSLRSLEDPYMDKAAVRRMRIAIWSTVAVVALIVSYLVWSGTLAEWGRKMTKPASKPLPAATNALPAQVEKK